MDYAFAPGASGYDGMIRRMYSYRPSTTLINKTGVNSVKDFFDHLAVAGTITTPPLDNILIGSHGNESGWMNVQLDPAFGAHTTYEAIESVMAAIPRTCQIADAIINPRPVDGNNQPINASLYIRGCRIGVMTAFIQKLKDAINGLSTTDIGVSAPKFFHEVYEMTQGIFELFNYDFHLYTNTPATNKGGLVTKLKALNYTDIYGTAITDAQWNKWVGTNITRDVDPLVTVTLASSPIPHFPSLRAGFYRYRYSTIVSFTIDPSVGALPTSAAAIATLLKQQFHDLATNPGTNQFGLMLQDTHPFPLYKRYEYNSIDEMIDGLKWILNSSSRTYTGKRYEYSVCPPVINNNANNEVIYNFFASPSGGSATVRNFNEDDANYFNTV